MNPELLKLEKRRRVKARLRKSGRQLAAMKGEFRKSHPELGATAAKRIAQRAQRALVRTLVSREMSS